MTALPWEIPNSLGPYANLTSDTNCQLVPCLDHAGMNPTILRHTADRLANQGAEGLFFWNGMVEPLVHYGPAWTAVREMGHINEIISWKNAGEPSLEPPVIDIDMLGDWPTRYVTPA
mgnify:FL=1